MPLCRVNEVNKRHRLRRPNSHPYSPLFMFTPHISWQVTGDTGHCVFNQINKKIINEIPTSNKQANKINKKCIYLLNIMHLSVRNQYKNTMFTYGFADIHDNRWRC